MSPSSNFSLHPPPLYFSNGMNLTQWPASFWTGPFCGWRVRHIDPNQAPLPSPLFISITLSPRNRCMSPLQQCLAGTTSKHQAYDSEQLSKSVVMVTLDTKYSSCSGLCDCGPLKDTGVPVILNPWID
ncbi:hypothetical protein J4Q44_G00184550 [Coregonus suidteri]|uniref:Uncharacterized protein n=1 Tax=Coregonus suidteri TaxID=861788 RepID=A0AAN8QNZ8_9TELE